MPERVTKTPESEPPRRLFGLRTRLLLLVALALSPIFVLAGIHATIDAHDARETMERELVAAARLLAHDQEILLRSTSDLMAVMVNLPAIAALGDACDETIASLALANDAYTNFAVVDLAGRTLCSGVPDNPDLGLSDRDWFRDVIVREEFVIGQSLYGPASGESVLAAGYPMFRDGELFAVMVTGIRVSILEQLGIAPAHDTSGRIAGIVDRTGRVVTERMGLQISRIESERLVAAALGEVVVFERRLEGRDGRILALAPLIDSDVFVLVAAPKPHFFSWRSIDLSGTLLLPVLMWALALVTVWIAADYLVLRWLAYLGRIARLYGHGRYDVVPVRASDAPSEIRDLADAFQQMAARISERDGELIDELDQKQMLIREVHHRVKNNLQIITSLLNLQLGSVRDENAIRALKEAQSRINALALIHRNLYEVGDLRFIRVSPFLAELARLTHAAGPGESGGVHLDFQSTAGNRDISTDQAVPLAMFMTEAMTNAYKHAFRDKRPGQVLSVSVRDIDKDGEHWIQVSIMDNGPGMDPNEKRRGVGSTLFEAFAIQLGGESAIASTPGDGTTVSLGFPLTEVDPESRGPAD